MDHPSRGAPLPSLDHENPDGFNVAVSRASWSLRPLSQSPFAFLTTNGFLARTLLNQFPEFRAAAMEDLLFVYVTAKSVN